MSKTSLSFDELLDNVGDLSYKEIKDMIIYHAYLNDKTSYQSLIDMTVNLNFQRRLEKLGVNSYCPNCNSKSIIKFGKKKNTQQYKCLDCNRRFNRFTNTILEKTKWHWDIWIEVLHLTINSVSLEKIINVLEKDFGCTAINYKTLFLWRHKLIHALAQMPMPKLNGVIQIDETFIRESQKGSRRLVSYLGNGDIRKPRYGRRPSKLGTMGPEFATVTTAIDNHGYSVCKVSSLGKLTKELLMTLFEGHFDNPSFICSDANGLYEEYCEYINVPHYIKPSNYLTVIENNGYVTPDRTDPIKAKQTEEKNTEILRRLYRENMIDHITNRGRLSYDEFVELKKLNSLSLARVNELHSDIKKFINREMTNVSTKYLQDYISFFTYIRNWRVKNGHYPSSRKDAENIFIEILQKQGTFTTSNLNNQVLELPKPSPKYISNLKTETDKVRAFTANKFFKFDEEDGVKTFNKREYLTHQPKSKLLNICKKHELKKYRKLALYSLVSEILKLPKIDEIIAELVMTDRHYHIAEEDLLAISSLNYKKIP